MSSTIELDIPVLSSSEIDSLNVIRAENAAKAELAEKSAAPVSAKINLLDLNRKQMREFSSKWVKNRSVRIRS
jgi:23S rRNA (adenine2503-C2)-methyltransferase